MPIIWKMVRFKIFLEAQPTGYGVRSKNKEWGMNCIVLVWWNGWCHLFGEENSVVSVLCGKMFGTCLGPIKFESI